MADEAGEVNTAVGDGDARRPSDEPGVSGAAAGVGSGDGEGSGRTENPAPAAPESAWSAPILSLARKATETISSGVSYAVAPRNPSQGSAASPPTEREPENDLGSASKKLPGRSLLCLPLIDDTRTSTFH